MNQNNFAPIEHLEPLYIREFSKEYASRIVTFAFFLLVLLLFISCEEFNLTEGTPEQSKQVTFALSTFEISQESMTRAGTSISATPTRLLVLDVDGNGNVQTLEKTTSAVPEGSPSGLEHADDVLENLTLTLTYGQHDIYILAAVNPYVSYSTTDKTVLWNVNNRPSYTWAKKVTVNVSKESSGSQEVALPVVIGRVDLICKDAQDSSVSKMRISGKMCWTLDLTTMKGVTPTEPWTYSIAISDKSAGLLIGAYSFEPSVATQGATPNIGNLTFTALKTVGGVDSEITSHTLTNVPVTAGYITKYTGFFYSNTPGFTLSVADAWTGTYTETY